MEQLISLNSDIDFIRTGKFIQQNILRSRVNE